MAGPNYFIPVSEPHNTFFLETLLNDNHPNISQNPLEVDVPLSALTIHAPTSPQNVQNSIPTVVNNNSSMPLTNSYSYRSRAEQNLTADGMSINDFQDYFHLPLIEAARRVRLCRNAVKKIMRKGGINAWPYMIVRNAMRQINRLRMKMSPDDPVSRATAKDEIIRLKLKMVKACGGIVPTVALDA